MYTIKISTPFTTYRLHDNLKTDVVNFKEQIDLFLSSNYGFFTIEYEGEEILLGSEALLKSEISIYKQEL